MASSSPPANRAAASPGAAAIGGLAGGALGATAGLAALGAVRTFLNSEQGRALLGGVQGAASGALANLLNSGRSNPVTPDITFPSDLLDGGRNYHMSMKFIKYQRRAIADQATVSVIGGIRLPIPNELSDTHRALMSPVEMGPMMGALLDATASNQSLVQGLQTGITNAMQATDANSMFTALRNGVVAGAGGVDYTTLATTAGAAYAAQQLGRTNIGALSALSGAAINPFMTVVYQNPALKNHSFSWKMIPRSQQESDNVMKIIKTLQQNMLPSLNPGQSVIFNYPNLVEVELHPKSDYLYKFKRCFIQDITVNYAGGGVPAFYKSGAPVSINVSITLQEIEMWKAEDFGYQTVQLPLSIPGLNAPAAPGSTNQTPGI